MKNVTWWYDEFWGKFIWTDSKKRMTKNADKSTHAWFEPHNMEKNEYFEGKKYSHELIIAM